MDGCKKRAVVAAVLQSAFLCSPSCCFLLTYLLACLFEMDWEEATSEEVSEVLEKNSIHSSTVECLRGELAHAYTTTCIV